jgi:hypothetical protein
MEIILVLILNNSSLMEFIIIFRFQIKKNLFKELYFRMTDRKMVKIKELFMIY